MLVGTMSSGLVLINNTQA